MVKEGKSKYPNKKAAKGKKLVTSIVVDDRERQVIPFFEEFADIRVSTARMTTGDYAIVIKSEDTGQYVPAVYLKEKRGRILLIPLKMEEWKITVIYTNYVKN